MNTLKFELFKELKKKSFIILIFLILITCFFTVFVNKKNNNKIYESYEINNYQDNYDKKLYENYVNKTNEINIVNEYKNQNNSSVYNVFDNTFVLILFLSFACAISSGTLISGEYESGVIKNLKGKYGSKNKLLTNKIIISFVLTTIYLLTLLIGIILFTSIIFKVNIFSLKYPVLNGSSIKLINYFKVFLFKYFINSIPIYFISLLSIFISLITKKSFVTVMIISLLSVIGPGISNIFISISFKLITYTFISYLDFSIFNNQSNILLNNMYYGINLSVINGIIILLYSSIIIIYLMFIINKKCEYK